MALRVWVKVENKYPAKKTTPNNSIPSYSQQAKRRGSEGVSGSVVGGVVVGEVGAFMGDDCRTVP
jgi:hypothetical protein